MNTVASKVYNEPRIQFRWYWIPLVLLGCLLLALIFVDSSQLPEGLRLIASWIGQVVTIVVEFSSLNYPLVLVTIAFVAYFPCSVFAYRKYQVPTRVGQLSKDFKFLFVEDSKLLTKEFKNSLSPDSFVWHVTLAMFITFIGTWLLLNKPDGFKDFATENTVQAMRYGFLGAYLYSIQLIYRRYTTLDLQPAVFMYCSLTLIAGLVFNYVAFETITDVTGASSNSGAGVTAGISAIVAFSLGYFPALAITWFNKLAFAGLGVTKRHNNEKPLSLIEGISQFHESRLRDNGIDNVQNLATADIRALLLNTTFSAQEVIDWIDQAILLVYLDKESITHFRDVGIRALSDFNASWNRITARPDDKNAIAELSQELKTSPMKLEILADAMTIGPNVHYVGQYWGQVSAVTEQKRQIHREEMLHRIQKLGESQYHPGSREQTLDPELKDFLRKGRYRGEDWKQFFETPEDLLGLAFGLQMIQKYSKACEVYEEILKTEPENIPALSNLAFVSMQDPEKTNEDVEDLADKGIAIANRVDNLNPESHALLFQTKAEMLKQSNDFEGALKYLQTAYEIDNLSDYSKQILADQINELNQALKEPDDIATTLSATSENAEKIKSG